ncbi:MAG: hypothetical protein PHT77_13110 [Bacteroidales bacterium]|nr:hypothetical protein [Bacteroidales bacterium]
MDDRLKEYVKDVLVQKDFARFADADRVRFSIAVEDHTNRQLEHIAKLTGSTKTALARQLIEVGIQEFEEQLGLSFKDPKYSAIIFPSYRKEIEMEDGSILKVTVKGHGELPPESEDE